MVAIVIYTLWATIEDQPFLVTPILPHSLFLMGNHCQNLVSALGASDESQEITTGVTPRVGGSAPALGCSQALISSQPNPSL